MQVDIADWIARLQAGAATVPGALIAVFLLAGPTLGWLLYRFVVQPRTRRRIAGPDLAAMWVCANCRSVNELRMDRCYRCDARPVEDELELIDADPAGPRRLTPVGPGLDLDAPARLAIPERTDRGVGTGGSGVAAEVAGLLGRAEPQITATRRRKRSAQAPSAGQPRNVVQPRTAAAGTRRSVPVGPGRTDDDRREAARPEVGRPRRAVVAGRSPDPDDPPAA